MMNRENFMCTARGIFIAGRWAPGRGDIFESLSPWDGGVLWRGTEADEEQVSAAVLAAREALPSWAGRNFFERQRILARFATELDRRCEELTRAIALETGKPLWEARGEISSMIGKLQLTLEAFEQRCAPQQRQIADAVGGTRFKPHGVAAVFGPFNMPGHLPNGHIMPALLAGNTIVFKPSERTPWTAELTVELWREAGLPPGVMNLVQGSQSVGEVLAKHPGLDAIFFTGSFAAGQAILRANQPFPHRLLALEMGGNNPLLVFDCADAQAAAYHTIVSAFLTAGQRCTCARRLIVPTNSDGRRFIDVLVEMTGRVRCGGPLETPEPFMGPVITPAAVEKLLAVQNDLIARGARPLTPARRIADHSLLLAPGILDVTDVADRADEELFGPLLQVIRTPDFEQGLDEANQTRFGLCAALLSDRRDLFDLFYARVRAGLLHFNRPTNGASGALPFGGVGYSGNHRPSGFWAVDYCSYPVATLESVRVRTPTPPLPGITI